MVFEELTFDLANQRAHHLLVGDEVFSGARVEWEKFMRGDRVWFFELLVEALGAWGFADPDPQCHWRLRVVDAAAPSYALARCDDASVASPVWSDAPAWASLSPETQENILGALSQCLELVHGLLLIY